MLPLSIGAGVAQAVRYLWRSPALPGRSQYPGPLGPDRDPWAEYRDKSAE